MFELDFGTPDFKCLVAKLKHAAAITPLSCGLDSRCAVDIRNGGNRQVPEPVSTRSSATDTAHHHRTTLLAYRGGEVDLAKRLSYGLLLALADLHRALFQASN